MALALLFSVCAFPALRAQVPFQPPNRSNKRANPNLGTSIATQQVTCQAVVGTTSAAQCAALPVCQPSALWLWRSCALAQHKPRELKERSDLEIEGVGCKLGHSKNSVDT